MRKCAFLTLEHPADFVIDDEHAVAPLRQLGWEVSVLPWTQEKTSWGDFEAVVIRSTWDYWNNVPAFLETLSGIHRRTRLANPLDLVHWNLAKTYMRDLEGKGVGIVPTLWPDVFHAAALPSFRERLGSADLVVKPVVGANGEDAFRLSPGDPPGRVDDIARRFVGRDSMVQSFMPAVVSEGEYSMFYFNGRFSHAILKVPAASEFRSQEERGAEIRLAVPEALLRERGREAMGALSTTPLYARVDFVRTPGRDFAVMELELIEPSLYLRMDPDAPARFARAVDAYFSS
ncbi:MAG: hypothetical protein PVJ33_03930 [Lysobacterales bacterium]|jgi:hypothetical protein